MCFRTFFIFAFLGMAAAVSGMNCYAQAPAAQHARRAEYRQWSSPDRVSIERDSGWGERYVRRPVPIPPQQYSPQYSQPVDPAPQNMHYGFPQMGMNDDIHGDGSVDFDWPHFAMALVLLTGGTLVCRRIFRTAAGPYRLTQIRQCRQPTRPAQSAPPAVQTLSRMCPAPTAAE